MATVQIYKALTNLSIDPASLGLSVTEQEGFDYDDRFNGLGGATTTTIEPGVSKTMFYKSVSETLKDLKMTGNEPVIALIMAIIAAAKSQ